MSDDNNLTDRDVHDLTRLHQSSGRSLLYSMIGATDVEESSKGAWITTRSGSEFLDLGSYGVFLLGHSHSQVVSAVRDQLERLPGSSRSFPSMISAAAPAALSAVAPPGLTKVMVLNSGAEAVEAALKLARASTGRTSLAHLESSFHGKTMGALSLTDSAVFRKSLGPLLDDVIRLPRDNSERAAAMILENQPAAVFAEPVQGEGGVYPLTAEFAQALRAACDEVGALLVFDEIQSGLGRTGEMWAHDPLGVIPDIMTVGKALGGGIIPVSAIVATTQAFRPYDLDPLLHTSTFGGNPLGSAAMVASLDVISAQDVPAQAGDVGVRLRTILAELVDLWPKLFAGVTGRGSFLGLQCRRPDIAGEMIRATLAERLLVTACLTAPSTLRFTPSAFLRDEELEFARCGLGRASSVVYHEVSSNL
ncbi:MAG: aspartate aminotransferase family protein [Rhodoglobus sp.]